MQSIIHSNFSAEFSVTTERARYFFSSFCPPFFSHAWSLKSTESQENSFHGDFSFEYPTVFQSFWSVLMLLIAFMLNILKIRFDFLCSNTVLSGKWKAKTQHEETIFLSLYYHEKVCLCVGAF